MAHEAFEARSQGALHEALQERQEMDAEERRELDVDTIHALSDAFLISSASNALSLTDYAISLSREVR